MKRLRSFFAASAAELKNTRSLTVAALLAAIYAVSYSPFAGNIVVIPGYMEFRFGFLALAVAGALCGPVAGILVAVLGDFIGTILFYGGSFFFGYPISWALTGFVFGCFLYKERLTLPRMIGANLLTTIAVNQFLTTLWQHLSGFGPYGAIFVSRIPRNAVMFPVNTVLLILVLRGIETIYRRVRHAA